MSGRLVALDLTRGLIMMVMSWDHTRDFLSDGELPQNQAYEIWSGPFATYDNNGALFFQRFITHFCAPGFQWLMGVGMTLFTVSRLKRGWTWWQIEKHFLVRGSLLILFDRVVNLPFYSHMVRPSTWSSSLPGPLWSQPLIGIFQVMTCLGETMILCGLLVPLVCRWTSSLGSICGVAQDSDLLTTDSAEPQPRTESRSHGAETDQEAEEEEDGAEKETEEEEEGGYRALGADDNSPDTHPETLPGSHSQTARKPPAHQRVRIGTSHRGHLQSANDSDGAHTHADVSGHGNGSTLSTISDASEELYTPPRSSSPLLSPLRQKHKAGASQPAPSRNGNSGSSSAGANNSSRSRTNHSSANGNGSGRGSGSGGTKPSSSLSNADATPALALDWNPLHWTIGQYVAGILGVGCFALSNAVIVYYQAGDPGAPLPWPRAGAAADAFSDYLVRFLILPGSFTLGTIGYPLLPWLGLCLLGIAAGQDFVAAAAQRTSARRSLVQGLICWVAFVILRSAGGSIGNFRGWQRGEMEDENGVIAFLSVCKYPPDPVYALLTLGGVLLVYVSFWQMEALAAPAPGSTQEFSNPNMSRWLRVPMVYFLVLGRVPLFFYVLHFLLLGVIGAVLHTFSSGIHITYLPLFWFPFVVSLFFACRPYAAFKHRQPTESLWRFL